MHVIDLKDEQLSMVELLLNAGALINHETLVCCNDLDTLPLGGSMI